MKLSIVIPIYNEEKTLRDIITAVETADLSGWDREIVLVNDASTDTTKDILKEYEGVHTIIHHSLNGGKGTAVKTGLAHATGDYIVIQDADLEYSPEELSLFLDEIHSGAQVVYGSRNLHPTKREGFLIPRFGVWLITALINGMYGQKLTDVWTCYKLFPQETKDLFIPGHFESELLFTTALLREGYDIREVPISHNPRDVKEGKKITYTDGLQALMLLFLEKMLYLRKPYTRYVKDTQQLLACPACKSELIKGDQGFVCKTHGVFAIDEFGRPFLATDTVVSRDKNMHHSGINWLKTFLKQFPKLYYSIWHMFCPALMLIHGPRKILTYVPQGARILDIGSGPERLGDEFINVDIFPFPEVDIVADAAALPFRDGSIDAVVSESVLEHVREPKEMAQEMLRVLKPGGYLYASVPFIHPFHASPDDFNRWTINGLKHLFGKLDIVEAGVRSGPWSALLLFLAYWFGILFSFGSERLAPFMAHVFMLILGPLKYLDLIFMKFPGSHAVATHVYVIGKKPTTP